MNQAPTYGDEAIPTRLIPTFLTARIPQKREHGNQGKPCSLDSASFIHGGRDKRHYDQGFAWIDPVRSIPFGTQTHNKDL
jgi:hypothetical protein